MKRLICSVRSVVVLTIIFLITVVASGCEKGDCMTSPPYFLFQIADADKSYPADLNTGSSLKIYHLDQGNRRYVGDIRVAGDFFQAGMLIFNSRAANDPEFYLEIDDKVVSRMKLETYTDNTKCNGWDRVSKVMQGTEVVERQADHTYILKVVQ